MREHPVQLSKNGPYLLKSSPKTAIVVATATIWPVDSSPRSAGQTTRNRPLGRIFSSKPRTNNPHGNPME